MAGNKAIFEIRPEKPSDVTDIFDLTQRAFAPMQFSDGSEPACVNALRLDGDLALSLVAVVAGAIVGHVAFSPATVQGTKNGWLGLGPVSVDPDFQGQGIGSWLVVAAIAAARRLDARYLVVLGEPAWYARFGFEPATRYGLGNEYGAGDAFQVLPLRIGALPPEGGLIRYAPPFAALADTGPDA